MIISCIFRSCANKTNFFVRHKHKDTHWSVVRKKKSATTKALEHFDDFYKQVFSNKWPAIRNGLLGKQKYIAVVNNYSDTDEIKTRLENIGALNIRTLFHLEKEYITSQYEKLERQKELQTIWALDKKLDKAELAKQPIKTDQIQEAVVNSDSANHVFNARETEIKEQLYNLSLEKSLEHAEYDVTRIIDSENVLSTVNLYEFIPVTKIKGLDDWIPESTHYKYYSNAEFPITVEKEYDLHFPEHLNVYCYETANFTDFDPPNKGSTGVYDYYLMDGGSLLPVLALNLTPGNRILDMCASPGGKTILALQTLYPDYVVSNDVSKSRVNRVYSVLTQYFYDLNERWLKTGKIKVTNIDGRNISDDDFDRILVDVPCTIDRHSVIEDDNNIFKSGRIKERLQLPELQCQLLVQALKLICKGGIVVYSTCSLSPIQNEGVVHMALKQIWEETKLEIVIKDLSPGLVQTRTLFKMMDQTLMKYGHLVIPNVNVNFGPTYFCKLQRVK